MKSLRMLHPLFKAGIELVSICSLHTIFSGRDQRVENFGSESSVQGTSMSAFVPSSSKGKEHLSFHSS